MVEEDEKIAGPPNAEAELMAQLQRARADLINFRNRVARERDAWSAEAKRTLLRDLLPVADGLARALAVDPSRVVEGVRLVEALLGKVLTDHGVKAVDAAGRRFDPAFHEACVVEETAEFEAGTVIQVIESGYEQDGMVLRPARVKVARAPTPPTTTPTPVDSGSDAQ